MKTNQFFKWRSSEGLRSVLLGLFPVLCGISYGGEGELTREVWTNLPGDSVVDLTHLPQFHGGADTVELFNSATVPNYNGNEYGSRLRGFITAPVTGDYTFWISGDDAAELWLSSDGSKFNASLIAETELRTQPLEWDKYPDQKSETVQLAEGEQYYFEAIHKEGLYEDHLAVAWEFRESSDSINLTQLAGAIASQSSLQWSRYAENAIDGNQGGQTWEGDLISQTTDVPDSWWQVDLGNLHSVDSIVLWNQQGELDIRLTDFRISLLDENGAVVISRDFHTNGTHVERSLEWLIPGAANAQTCRIEKLGPSSDGTHFLTLAEVEVFGVELTNAPNEHNLALQSGATANQSEQLWSRFATNAIDGNTGGARWLGDLISTSTNVPGSWWEVDLGAEASLSRIVVWNELGNLESRLANIRVSLISDSGGVALSSDFFTDGSHAGASFEWDWGHQVRARKVRIDRLGPDPNGDHYINLAEVEVFGFPSRLQEMARSVIPNDYLESFTNEASDLDDDSLLDSWEQTHGFDTTTWETGDYAFLADSDGDFRHNGEESQLGTNPFLPDEFPNLLTRERWFNIPQDSLQVALLDEDHIYEPADAITMVAGSSTGFSSEKKNYHQRLRGYLHVPETGQYRFWISARYGAQFFLSTGDDKYHKQLLIEVGPEVGTGNGAWEEAEDKWDWYVSQMSEEVYLEAGQKYFLEVLNQHGHWEVGSHISLAWARPESDREPIPADFLSSYHRLNEDGDDDSLPDSWESTYGLSITDNGLLSRDLEGERGDFDTDGLSNREEYVMGTNPADADSDGDGLSDLEEVQTYGTDPSVSDATPDVVVAELDLGSVAGMGTTWTDTGAGVLTTSFRGEGVWNFTVPEDGFWLIQLQGALRGDLRFEEVLPVQVSVDGGEVERVEMGFRNSLPGSLRVLTPWLAAGQHELSLFIDNYTARRSLEITAIKIIEPGGLDLDDNTYPDWVEAKLTERSGLLSNTVVESPISPVFIEGRARSLGHFEMRFEHEGVASFHRELSNYWGREVPKIKKRLTNQLQGSSSNRHQNFRLLQRYRRWVSVFGRHQQHGHGGRGIRRIYRSLSNSRQGLLASPQSDRSVVGDTFLALDGPGYGTWFTELPLRTNQATSYCVFFENGALGDSGVVVWRPLNLMETSEISIPVGSDLLMSAWDRENDNSPLTFTIDGQVQPDIRARKSLVQSYPAAGQFTVSVLHHRTGDTFSLAVDVRDANLQPDITLAELRFSDVALPGVEPDLSLDSGGEVLIRDFQASQVGGSEAEMGGIFPGTHRVATRLPTTEAILDQEVVHVVGVSDGTRNASDLIVPQGDGIFLVKSPLLLTHLPAGATVEVTIFAGGVTFPDGTTTKTLTASDFDENGVYILEFLMPMERLGAACHYLRVYDSQGQQIW